MREIIHKLSKESIAVTDPNKCYCHKANTFSNPVCIWCNFHPKNSCCEVETHAVNDPTARR